ncbi:MAG TPA: hypothetical protein VFM05_02420 [Candidatus Saccharimonadales bacterium]|nr:hypothetical protein [Candidatus Saccharimonadales bacterium]
MDKNVNQYAKEAMSWYGWGSPVGLGIGVFLTVTSLGLFLWLLHLANLLG